MNVKSNSEYIALYLNESKKLLGSFDKIITDSDRENRLTDSGELFRILHTLKGSSAMMEYAPLTDIAHRFENIISQIKKTASAPTDKTLQTLIDAGLAFSSYYTAETERIGMGGQPAENPELISILDLLAANFGAAISVKKDVVTDLPKGEVQRVVVKLKKCPLPHIRASIIVRAVTALCSTVFSVPDNIAKVSGMEDSIINNGFEIHFIPKNEVSVKSVIDKIITQPFVVSCSLLAETKVQNTINKSEVPDQNVIVSQKAVNMLINRIDELMTEQSTLEAQLEAAGIQSNTVTVTLSELRRTMREVSILSSALQSSSVADIFIQMQKTVRNMAKQLNKEVKVQFSGEDTEVDKSVIDVLTDALIHMVRNCVDHGIEAPQDRISSGKPEIGTVYLTAIKKNDYLTVSVKDDGRGVDCDSVLKKADKMGILKKPANDYTKAETLELLFSSGLTTNTDVTQYSGRGVGLDTVIRRIKQVAGSVTVKSDKGKGTEFILKIPVTLSVIDGIVSNLYCGEKVIIPSSSVLHITDCSKTCISNKTVIFSGKEYRYLPFPGESIEPPYTSGYVITLDGEIGYYLYIKEIDMLSSYYVKPIPDYILSKLGKRCVFSGCVICEQSKILCVLDTEKLALL